MEYSTVIKISKEELEQERANARPVTNQPATGGFKVVKISREEFEAEKKGIQKQQKNLAQPGNARSSMAIEAEENIETFKQRMGEAVKTRIQQASDILREEGPYQGPTDMFDTENQGLSTTSQFLGLAGSMAGLGWDLFGEVYTLSTDGYSLVIPDEMEDAVKEQYREAVQVFVEHPLGKEAQKALQAGQEAWVEFKKNNPEISLVVESAFNVGAWFRRGPDAKPVNVDRESGYVPNVSFFDPKNRTVNKLTALEQGIWKAIRPPKTAEQINKQTTEPKFPFRRQETILTVEERRRVDTVKRYARVDPSRTDRTNAKSISDAITKIDERLKKLLSKRTDLVSHDDLMRNVQSKIAEYAAGNQGKGIERINRNAKDALAQLTYTLKSYEQTASGMLEARRALDTWVNDNLGKDTLKKKEGKRGSQVRDDLYTLIRREMNNMLDTGDSNTANRLLRDESDLLSSLGAINGRIPQGDTVMARIRDNLGALNIHMPTTPLGQAATATAAMNSKMLPFFAGLITTYTGFGLAKRLFSKAYYQKELRLILESLNEGVKAATNPEMVKQLRADRAAIIEVYKGYMEDAEEEAKEE